MKAFKIKTISRDDTLALKAIGIILIVLHNYFRWVKPITGENEFGMSAGYLLNSFHALKAYPLEFVNVFFNLLGHYGVQIFIFLSAYGLTKAYDGKSIQWKQFVVKRFFKLYPTLLIATFAMILFNVAAHGNLPSKKLLIEFAAQLSLLSTVIPGKALVAVGPWWFYSMIFQFYLVFPVLLWINNEFKGKGLLVLSIGFYLILIFVNPFLKEVNLNLLHTAFGHIPEFCVGIWLATRKEIKINILLYFLAVLVFVFGNYYRIIWCFSHLAAIIVMLPLLQFVLIKIKRNELISRIISFIGLISVYIFAVHGFLRWGFVGLANFLNYPIAEFLVGVMFLLFSIGIAWLLFNTENQMRNWIHQSNKNRSIRTLILVVLMAGLVFSVKSCESINYSKKQKQKKNQKEVVKKRYLYDFEELIEKKYTVVDTVSFSGKRSCVITPEKEYGPVHRINIIDIDISKIKEVRFTCVIFNNHPNPSDIHAVFELRKSNNNARLGWKNSSFQGDVSNGKWIKQSSSFKIESSTARPDSYAKFYIWNNSDSNVIIDDFGIEIIYME